MLIPAVFFRFVYTGPLLTRRSFLSARLSPFLPAVPLPSRSRQPVSRDLRLVMVERCAASADDRGDAPVACDRETTRRPKELQIRHILCERKGDVEMSGIMLRVLHLPFYRSVRSFRSVQQISAREKHIYFQPPEITDRLNSRALHLDRDAAVRLMLLKVVDGLPVKGVGRPGPAQNIRDLILFHEVPYRLPVFYPDVV